MFKRNFKTELLLIQLEKNREESVMYLVYCTSIKEKISEQKRKNH